MPNSAEIQIGTQYTHPTGVTRAIVRTVDRKIMGGALEILDRAEAGGVQGPILAKNTFSKHYYYPELNFRNVKSAFLLLFAFFCTNFLHFLFFAFLKSQKKYRFFSEISEMVILEVILTVL